MPHFVLLYHDCPPQYERPSHWDFMLEEGDHLRTWALARLPREWTVARARTLESYPHCSQLAASNTVAAEPLGDHRLDYLQLEGKLSGDRGQVRRIDAGSYITDKQHPESWQVRVDGVLLRGKITLRQSKPLWTLEFELHD
jgi:hypothetical protein